MGISSLRLVESMGGSHALLVFDLTHGTHLTFLHLRWGFIGFESVESFPYLWLYHTKQSAICQEEMGKISKFFKKAPDHGIGLGRRDRVTWDGAGK